MKKYLFYIAIIGFLFASCEKLPPLQKVQSSENDPALRGSGSDEGPQDQSASSNGEKSDRPDGDLDLDVITDPNNDEDYDGEGKKPVVDTSSNN